MKQAAGVLVAALVLAACGTVSAETAVRQWRTQSNFSSAQRTLRGDVAHARSVLVPARSALARHTACAVLLDDAKAANSSLPSPDDQANQLLRRAYDLLGAGATICYSATTERQFANSAQYLDRAIIQLRLGALRLMVASSTS